MTTTIATLSHRVAVLEDILASFLSVYANTYRELSTFPPSREPGTVIAGEQKTDSLEENVFAQQSYEADLELHGTQKTKDMLKPIITADVLKEQTNAPRKRPFWAELSAESKPDKQARIEHTSLGLSNVEVCDSAIFIPNGTDGLPALATACRNYALSTLERSGT